MLNTTSITLCQPQPQPAPAAAAQQASAQQKSPAPSMASKIFTQAKSAANFAASTASSAASKAYSLTTRATTAAVSSSKTLCASYPRVAKVGGATLVTAGTLYAMNKYCPPFQNLVSKFSK